MMVFHIINTDIIVLGQIIDLAIVNIKLSWKPVCVNSRINEMHQKRLNNFI